MKVRNGSSSMISGKYMLKLNPAIDAVITIPVVVYQQLRKILDCNINRSNITCKMDYHKSRNNQTVQQDQYKIQLYQTRNKTIELQLFDQGCRTNYDKQTYPIHYLCSGRVGLNSKGIIELGRQYMKDKLIITHTNTLQISDNIVDFKNKYELQTVTKGEVRNITSQLLMINDSQIQINSSDKRHSN